jgi:hypothetical protein
MDKVAEIMRADLRDALAKGYTRDANDLAVYATASGVREDLNKLVILASDVLNEAGYCECGVKFSEGSRCNSCGRLLPKRRYA